MPLGCFGQGVGQAKTEAIIKQSTYDGYDSVALAVAVAVAVVRATFRELLGSLSGAFTSFAKS